MKAWILTKQGPIEHRPLELVDLPMPRPREHEIRVKVQVCGLCRTDLHIAEGDLPLKKTPLVLGHEVVGVVDEVGSNVIEFREGDKVGVTWFAGKCGICRHCREGRENYCPAFQATGWDLDGGLAEYILVSDYAAMPLKDLKLPDEEIAPLMCPGVAGYCAFRLTNAEAGEDIGLYGFGPTAYYVIKAARHLGLNVYVSSRSAPNLERARQHGAVWAGDSSRSDMPKMLDSAIVFPAAGSLVEPALKQVKIGGVVVLAPVSMSRIEIHDYAGNFWGRDLRTLYNINASDARKFLALAATIDVRMGTEAYPFNECPDALIRVKQGKIKEPNAVILVSD
jgi:propanol-preferring alcohol dehydrogenase